MMQKTWKMTETLANGYSYESTQWELSNEYQHDRVSMVFKNICFLVLWMKVASALEGLSLSPLVPWQPYSSQKQSWYHNIPTFDPNSTFNPFNATATFVQSTRIQRFLKTIQTLSCWYSLENSCRALSDEYPFARVSVILEDFCIILYWSN